jgi:hypothetical protein
MRALVAWGLALLLSGCFHLAGQVVEERKAESTRIKAYQRRVPLPKRTSMALTSKVADGQIRVSVQAETWCRTEHVEVYRNQDRVTQHLPDYHWAILAGGFLAAAGGAVSWAIGSDLMPSAYSHVLTDPAEEADRDLGHVLVPVGMGLTALGALILGSHAADGLMLEETLRPLAETHRTVNHGSAPCSRGAASGLAIRLEPVVGPRHGSITIQTDSAGEARISVLESELWRIPYGEPFVTLQCKQCRPLTVTLPPRLGAQLVIKRQRREEMVSWLERHKDSALAGEVQSALDALKVVVQERARTNPNELYAAAKKFIAQRRYEDAKKVIDECATNHSGHKGCRILEVQFTRDRVEAFKKKANYFIRWRQPIKAVIWADKCLQFDPTTRACLSIKERAANRWSRTNMKGRYRIREVRTEAGLTQVKGDFRAPGRYAKMYLAIRLYRGRKELCHDKTTVTQVSARRAIAFQGVCDVAGRQPDGVKVTIDGYRL